MLAQASPKALATLNKKGWNTYVLRAQGKRIEFEVNGVDSVDYRETDSASPDGKIALSSDSGHPLEMTFENILIQPLPTPKADGTSTPGFHLRTLQTPDGPRKYTVYLPEGFDGKKPFPVILFLHGAGGRGEDESSCAERSGAEPRRSSRCVPCHRRLPADTRTGRPGQTMPGQRSPRSITSWQPIRWIATASS